MSAQYTTRDSAERLDLIERRLARIERILSEVYRDKSRGFVYIVADGHGRYKIGLAQDVDARLKQLATGGAAHALACSIEADNAYVLERALHAIYRANGRHLIREWYALAQSDIDALDSLAQPFFVEELPAGLFAVSNAAKQTVARPPMLANGTHPTNDAARALVATTEAARAMALFEQGADIADIIRELRGELTGRARQQASMEIQQLIREGRHL